LKGKTVWEQYRDNEFRQALQYMAMLYSEGLIAKDSFTMTGNDVLSLGENPTPILGIGIAAWSPEYWTNGGERWAQAFHVMPLKGPAGQQWGSSGNPNGALSARFFITDKCADPELALAWYDYMMNLDVWKTGSFGTKDIAWTAADPGTTGLGGGPATWKALIQQGLQPVNTSWDQASPSYASLEHRMAEQATGVPEVIRWLETGDRSLLNVVMNNKSFAEIEFVWFTANRSIPWAIPTDYFIPPLAMSGADASRVADIRATLDPFKEKAYMEFVTGVRNINNNSDWNAYLAELDRLNSKELVSIYQKYIK